MKTAEEKLETIKKHYDVTVKIVSRTTEPEIVLSAIRHFMVDLKQILEDKQ